jgi:hypothetical protein
MTHTTRPPNGKPRRAPARELAQRRSGTDEVLLLWHPESDRVELTLHDSVTGASFQIDVAPGDAIDAFYHPYAYMAGRDRLAA